MRRAPADQGAWRGALVACLLNVTGVPLDIVMGRGIPGMPRWPALAAAATGLVLATVLVVLPISTRLSSMIFVLNNTAIVLALWVTNTVYALSVPHWCPYQAYKLGSLAAALLAPQLWSGIVAVLSFSLGGVIHFETLPSVVQARLFGEPLASAIYGGFGLALLVYSERRRRLERAMAHAQIGAATLERLAESARALGDLANTPLQTIQLTLAVLRERAPHLTTELTRIDNAVVRLRQLKDVLQNHRRQLGTKAAGIAEALNEIPEDTPSSGGPERPTED